jgi:hypothetical protein
MITLTIAWECPHCGAHNAGEACGEDLALVYCDDRRGGCGRAAAVDLATGQAWPVLRVLAPAPAIDGFEYVSDADLPLPQRPSSN